VTWVDWIPLGLSWAVLAKAQSTLNKARRTQNETRMLLGRIDAIFLGTVEVVAQFESAHAPRAEDLQ